MRGASDTANNHSNVARIVRRCMALHFAQAAQCMAKQTKQVRPTLRTKRVALLTGQLFTFNIVKTCNGFRIFLLVAA